MLAIRPAVMVEMPATLAVVDGTILVDSTVGSAMWVVVLLLSTPGAAVLVVVGRPNTWVPNTTTKYKLNMFNNAVQICDFCLCCGCVVISQKNYQQMVSGSESVVCLYSVKD